MAQLEELRQLAAGMGVTPSALMRLDPQDEEHKEIRTLITDRVVERMEEEIAERKQERASGASS